MAGRGHSALCSTFYTLYSPIMEEPLFHSFWILVLSEFADLFALVHILWSAYYARLDMKLVLVVGRSVIPFITFMC